MMEATSCSGGVTIRLPEQALWARQLWWQSRAATRGYCTITLDSDRQQWQQCGSCEQQYFLDTLSLLAVIAPAVERNSLRLYDAVTDRMCQQYLVRQASEAVDHADLVVRLCNEFGIDVRHIGTVPAELAVIVSRFIDTQEHSVNLHQLIMAIVGCHLVVATTLLSTSLLLVQRSDGLEKMEGVCALFAWVMRDIARHHEFNVNLVNLIKKNYPEAWTAELQEELMRVSCESTEAVQAYVKRVLQAAVQESVATICQEIICLADYTNECIDLPRHFGTHGYPAWLVEKVQGEKQVEMSLEDDVVVLPVKEKVHQLER